MTGCDERMKRIMKLFEKKTGGIIAALVAGALIGGAATGVLAYSYSTDDLD